MKNFISGTIAFIVTMVTYALILSKTYIPTEYSAYTENWLSFYEAAMWILLSVFVIITAIGLFADSDVFKKSLKDQKDTSMVIRMIKFPFYFSSIVFLIIVYNDISFALLLTSLGVSGHAVRSTRRKLKEDDL